MQVKEVIALAAQNLGRNDLKEALDVGEEARAEGVKEELTSLLRCYNYVENEIALEYFPLRCEETLEEGDGKLLYTHFSRAPVFVHKADDAAGNKVDFKMFPAYLSLPAGIGKVTVTYSYAPEKKGENDESAFGERISARLMSYGVVSEFLLTAARYSEADMWQQRYREALRAAGILRRRLAVRARRWV